MEESSPLQTNPVCNPRLALVSRIEIFLSEYIRMLFSVCNLKCLIYKAHIRPTKCRTLCQHLIKYRMLNTTYKSFSWTPLERKRKIEFLQRYADSNSNQSNKIKTNTLSLTAFEYTLRSNVSNIICKSK